MDRLALTPGPGRPVVTVPGSKSLTNRALLIGALADGVTTLQGASESDDSVQLLRALRTIGFDATTERVAGQGGRIPAESAELSVGNAGTAFRFLTAMLALGRGPYRLDGDARMRERPIEGLAEALGGAVTFPVRAGYPPVEIRGTGGRLTSTALHVKGDVSSQFVSALLMVMPYSTAPMVDLYVKGTAVSKPYVEMTIQLMKEFGVRAVDRGNHYELQTGSYRGREIAVEGDAAAAGYHWARAAVTGGRVRVDGLWAACRQPEFRLLEDLEEMGARVTRTKTGVEVEGAALAGIDVDMNDRPDSVQTLAVVALFAKGRTRIRNVRNLRIKETDRLAALARELAKCGARVIEHADGLEIEPPGKVRGTEIETYGDHRMAMSFAVAGAAVDGVVILEPEVVSKSYPGFWEAWGNPAPTSR
jgi:3-phosphoshikimate 1-carboxyvinyltransferase